MNKKNILMIIAAILILAATAAGYAGYKKGWFKSEPPQTISDYKTLLTFDIKKQGLDDEMIQVYQEKFNEVKGRLEQDPESLNDWLYLGILKKSVEDFEGARQAWVYAGQVRPQNSSSFANLADLYAYFLNQPEKAEAAIKTAIANDPNDANLYQAMADIYRYKFPGREALYETTMLDAIAKFPADPNLVSQLAAYYKQTKQNQKAIEYYEKLIQLSPDNEQAKDDLARLKEQE